LVTSWNLSEVSVKVGQLHAVDGSLLHGQVQLAVGHGHRVRAERLHERDVRGRLLHPDGLALHVLGREDGPLVRHHVAKAPAAAEAEGLDALALHLPQQLLADRPVDDLPDLLSQGPEEGQVERLIQRLERAPDGRAADPDDVDGADLRAFQERDLALGEDPGDEDLELDAPLRLLVERLGDGVHGVVRRVAGADAGPGLELDGRLGVRGTGGEDERGHEESGESREHCRHGDLPDWKRARERGQ
jgi:hypothetical protein